MNCYGTSVRLRNTSRWSSAFRRRHCADGSRRSLALLIKTQAEACATKELTSGTPMRHENLLRAGAISGFSASPRIAAVPPCFFWCGGDNRRSKSAARGRRGIKDGFLDLNQFDHGAVGVRAADEAFLAPILEFEHDGLGPEFDAFALKFLVIFDQRAGAQRYPTHAG